MANDPDRATAGDDGDPDRSPGIRARIAVDDPPSCPVVDALPPGAEATDLRRGNAGDAVVEQFRTDADPDAEPVVAGEDGGVYRRTLPATERCPCRLVESLGYPTRDVRVRADPPRVSATLLLPSTDALSDVVDRLEASGASVSLRRLTRGPGDAGDDRVSFDRTRLTNRQREVLRTAHRLGYFAYPRETSAAAVADELGIARSTFAEHLAAAQATLFEEVLEP